MTALNSLAFGIGWLIIGGIALVGLWFALVGAIQVLRPGLAPVENPAEGYSSYSLSPTSSTGARSPRRWPWQ